MLWNPYHIVCRWGPSWTVAGGGLGGWEICFRNWKGQSFKPMQVKKSESDGNAWVELRKAFLLEAPLMCQLCMCEWPVIIVSRVHWAQKEGKFSMFVQDIQILFFLIATMHWLAYGIQELLIMFFNYLLLKRIFGKYHVMFQLNRYDTLQACASILVSKLWDFHFQGYRKWIYALKLYRTNFLQSDSLGLEIHLICPIVQFFGQLVMQTFRPCCVQHANGWVIVGQCFVKLSNIWTLSCPTVQLLVYSVSNSPMACELSVKQSNGWTVLFSNCPTVGQSCVQLSKGRIMLYQTVQWLDSAVSNHV